MKKWFLIICLSLMIAGCGSSEDMGGDEISSEEIFDMEKLKSVELSGEPVTVAGVTFRPPAEWENLGASGMRNASYRFGPIGEDQDSATLAVFFFGASEGGGVTSNMERWLSQMSLSDGKPPREIAVRQKMDVDQMTLHYMEVEGTYHASMGGRMMTPTIPKHDYLLSAAILEAPEGNLFFKLTGPVNTAREMNRKFQAMLVNIQKE
ncbi:MAG: hypothetical protein GF315_05270 [candidate division Zixibacteria bacterium]|nr:hypothetical protein [candidate division Zixibacteria bacterium]